MNATGWVYWGCFNFYNIHMYRGYEFISTRKFVTSKHLGNYVMAIPMGWQTQDEESCSSSPDGQGAHPVAKVTSKSSSAANVGHLFPIRNCDWNGALHLKLQTQHASSRRVITEFHLVQIHSGTWDMWSHGRTYRRSCLWCSQSSFRWHCCDPGKKTTTLRMLVDVYLKLLNMSYRVIHFW